MPLYVYVCEKCQGVVEQFRAVKDRETPAMCDLQFANPEIQNPTTDTIHCGGNLKFIPIQKSTFKFKDND